MNTSSKPDRSELPSIVHVASFAPEYGGNFIASIAELRRFCEGHGWSFALVLQEAARGMPWCHSLVEEGWRIHYLPSAALLWRKALILRGVIRRERSLIVHTHFSDFDLPAWLAAHLVNMRGGRTRVVWHVHSELSPSPSLFRRIKNFIKYWCLGRFAWIIAIGDSVAKGVLAAGAPSARVFTVANGIDLSRATKAARVMTEVRSELGIDDSQRLILMFGHDPVNKGVDLALEAMAEVVGEHPHTVLVIVGRENLRAYVDEKMGSPHPAWLRVMKPVENVADLYLAAEAFLSASRSEGFCFSVAEAMANGLPVVLSDIPGVSWAHQASGAVFFESEDSTALASRICQVLDWSESEREVHSLANTHLVRAEYNVEMWARRIMQCYTKILDS